MRCKHIYSTLIEVQTVCTWTEVQAGVCLIAVQTDMYSTLIEVQTVCTWTEVQVGMYIDLGGNRYVEYLD